MLITPEIAIRIIFTMIGVIVSFYAVVNLIFYKLALPGFEGKWVVSMSATLISIGVVLIALAYVIV